MSFTSSSSPPLTRTRFKFHRRSSMELFVDSMRSLDTTRRNSSYFTRPSSITSRFALLICEVYRQRFVPSSLTRREFPDNLGLIGMPYSQGRTAFANCLVAHEMWDISFIEIGYSRTPSKRRADAALKSLFDNYDAQTQEKKDRWIQVLDSGWAASSSATCSVSCCLAPATPMPTLEAYDLSAVLDSAGLYFLRKNPCSDGILRESPFSYLQASATV